MVVVAYCHTHAALFAAVLVYCRAGGKAQIFEGAVAVVVVVKIRRRVVGHINIDQTILVKVAANDAHSVVALRICHTGFFAYIGEAAVPVIVIESVTFPGQTSGTALHRYALVLAQFALAKLWQLIEVESDVVGDEEIEVTIAIVIDESCARRPSRIANLGLLCNIAESSIAVIFEEMIRPYAGDIKIVEAVVVIIRDRYAHAPADVTHPSFVRNISETTVAIVMVERAPGFSIRLQKVDGERVYEIDIQISVVVVVKNCYSATHRLYDISFLGRGNVFEIYSRLLGDIDKANARGLIPNHVRGD